MSENIMEGLLSEISRVRDIVTEYESLPSGAGMLAAAIMKSEIKQAEKAIATGDTIEMIYAYSKLKGNEMS
jgi:hypothetical protein